MAANGCRFSDFAFLRLFKCLFWSYLCLLAGYLCLCSRSFLRDFMESLFVAFSQLNPTHKTGCRDSFSILTCMTDSRFLVAGAMPSMIEKHWRSQLERRLERTGELVTDKDQTSITPHFLVCMHYCLSTFQFTLSEIITLWSEIIQSLHRAPSRSAADGAWVTQILISSVVCVIKYFLKQDISSNLLAFREYFTKCFETSFTKCF